MASTPPNKPRTKADRNTQEASPVAEADVAHIDYSGQQLAQTSWRGLRLRHVRFDDANLSGADFTGAYLEDVSIARSDLQRVKLRNATINGLHGVPLSWRGADAEGLNFLNVASLDLLMREAQVPPPESDPQAMGPDPARAMAALRRLGDVLTGMVLAPCPWLPEEVRQWEKALNALVQWAPRWYRPWSTLGKLWLQQGDAASATQAFLRAHQAFPGDPFAALSAAHCLIDAGQAHQALRVIAKLRQSISLDETCAEACATYEVHALASAQEWHECMQQSQRWAGRCPSQPFFEIKAAEAARALAQPTTALEALRRALGKCADATQRLEIHAYIAEILLDELAMPYQTLAHLRAIRGQERTPAWNDDLSALADQACQMVARHECDPFPLLTHSDGGDHDDPGARPLLWERAGLHPPEGSPPITAPTYAALARCRCALASGQRNAAQAALDELMAQPFPPEAIALCANLRGPRAAFEAFNATSELVPKPHQDLLAFWLRFAAEQDQDTAALAPPAPATTRPPDPLLPALARCLATPHFAALFPDLSGLQPTAYALTESASFLVALPGAQAVELIFLAKTAAELEAWAPTLAQAADEHGLCPIYPSDDGRYVRPLQALWVARRGAPTTANRTRHDRRIFPPLSAPPLSEALLACRDWLQQHATGAAELERLAYWTEACVERSTLDGPLWRTSPAADVQPLGLFVAATQIATQQPTCSPVTLHTSPPQWQTIWHAMEGLIDFPYLQLTGHLLCCHGARSIGADTPAGALAAAALLRSFFALRRYEHLLAGARRLGHPCHLLAVDEIRQAADWVAALARGDGAWAGLV